MNRLLKIVSFLLLMAVSAEAIPGFWVQADRAAVVKDNEKKDNKEADKENEDGKIKFYQKPEIVYHASILKQLFSLSHIHVTYSAYLSLPEIPPDFS